MKKKIIFVILVALIIVGVWLVIPKQKNQENKISSALEKVKVQAGWILNGEFANICSAIAQGYYKDEGLDVELVPGGPSGASFIIATNALAQDKSIDIAVDGDIVPLLRGITKDKPEERVRVKAFAAFWNENPYGFIVRKDSGINNFIDLATKRKKDGSKYKIGVAADSVAQFAIANYAKVPVKNLDITTVGFDASPFLLNKVDALAGYWTTQVYEVEKAGIDYKFLNYGDIPGFSQPSMVAMAREETLKNNPDMLVKWLRATIKGSEFVRNNPDKSADYVVSDICGGKALNKDQELWVIKKSIPLLDNKSIGQLNKNQLESFAKSYNKLGQIPFSPSIEAIADFSILNRVYGLKNNEK